MILLLFLFCIITHASSLFLFFLVSEVFAPAHLGEEQMALGPLGTSSFPPSFSPLISLLLLFYLRYVPHCYQYRCRGNIHIGVACGWCCWTLAWYFSWALQKPATSAGVVTPFFKWVFYYFYYFSFFQSFSILFLLSSLPFVYFSSSLQLLFWPFVCFYRWILFRCLGEQVETGRRGNSWP